MTKAEYLSVLQEKLESFNRELQKEIMEDYEQHFAEGLAAGRSEEEIIEELGDIEDMIQELPEEDIRQEIQPMEPVAQKRYEGEYKGIVIDGLVADITMEKSADGCIHVDYHNDGDAYIQQRYQFYQYDEDGFFHVGVRDCGNWEGRKKIMLFGKTLLSYNQVSQSSAPIELNVKIPAGMPEIKVKAVSGDVEVSGVCAGQLEMKTNSGDITLANMEGERLKVQVTSGDIQFSNLNMQKVQLQSASGDIDGNGVSGRELAAETGSGDVSLTGEMDEYAVKSGSGDVDLHVKKGAKRVRVENGSGDVSLDLTKIAGVEVNARVGSGECMIYGAEGERHQVSCGNCTVGSGDCKVHVITGSGDSEIRCR